METQVATLPYCCEPALDATPERSLAAAVQHVHPCWVGRHGRYGIQQANGLIGCVVSYEPRWGRASGGW